MKKTAVLLCDFFCNFEFSAGASGLMADADHPAIYKGSRRGFSC